MKGPWQHQPTRTPRDARTEKGRTDKTYDLTFGGQGENMFGFGEEEEEEEEEGGLSKCGCFTHAR